MKGAPYNCGVLLKIWVGKQYNSKMCEERTPDRISKWYLFVHYFFF
jgi:hypothetical protein